MPNKSMPRFFSNGLNDRDPREGEPLLAEYRKAQKQAELKQKNRLDLFTEKRDPKLEADRKRGRLLWEDYQKKAAQLDRLENQLSSSASADYDSAVNDFLSAKNAYFEWQKGGVKNQKADQAEPQPTQGLSRSSKAY